MFSVKLDYIIQGLQSYSGMMSGTKLHNKIYLEDYTLTLLTTNTKLLIESDIQGEFGLATIGLFTRGKIRRKVSRINGTLTRDLAKMCLS